jgi:hypothetical protein
VYIIIHKKIKMLSDAMKAMLASDDVKSFVSAKYIFSDESLIEAWEILVKNRSYRIIPEMIRFGDMWKRYQDAREWLKVRVLLESLIQTGNTRKIYACNDDLSPEEIQYLHTRGLFDCTLGMKNTKLDASITYLLLSLGSTLEAEERDNNMDSEELSRLYNLMIVPFSLVSSQEKLTIEMCRDVVLYDNFDNDPFIEMTTTNDYENPTPFNRWLPLQAELQPWVIYMLVTGDGSIDSDRILYELIIEEEEIYDYLITRGVRFSENLSKRLVMGLKFSS